MRNVLPSSPLRSRVNVPPLASTANLAIDKPSPLPPTSPDAVGARKKRSKMRSRTSVGTPGPLSTTSTTAFPADSNLAFIHELLQVRSHRHLRRLDEVLPHLRTVDATGELRGSTRSFPNLREHLHLALQPVGSRIPFFCLPGADENPYYFRDLAKALGQDQPFYVLRDPRPLQERGVYTLEEHAARFTAAIRSVRLRGPYILGGHCYGGILAFEAARQLISIGEE